MFQGTHTLVLSLLKAMLSGTHTFREKSIDEFFRSEQLALSTHQQEAERGKAKEDSHSGPQTTLTLASLPPALPLMGMNLTDGVN